MTLPAGTRLGSYEITGPLGAGGMGVVYRAFDTTLRRTVAIKLLIGAPEAAGQARLIQEARAASALNHPNICTIHEVREEQGQAFFVMEHVDGRPLKQLIPRGGLPGGTLLRYGMQIADALAHAHDHGIVHCDLKSTNVMITSDGRAKVLDFGVAKRLRDHDLDEVTRSAASLELAPSAIGGTLAYMAPELMCGESADRQSDIWALGVLLHEMACGELPFKGQTGFELSGAILHEQPAPLPASVSAGFRTVVQRCLAKDKGQRYQRAIEARAALETIQGDAIESRTHANAAGPSRTLGRPWARATGAILLSVTVIAGLVGLNVGGLRDRFTGRTDPGRIESLAVLPLENLSRDPEQEYFVDGMTEALITDLSKIGGLRVISRTSVMPFKGVHKPLLEIARALNVDAVVEGSVQRLGDRIRITAQLIHAATDRHLWADSYDRNARDVLALQSEMARTIANEVRVKVTPQEQKRLVSHRQVNPQAHEAFLRGRYFLEKWSDDGAQQAVDYFRRAIEADPNYAAAYAGLAETYLFGVPAIDPEEQLEKARTAVGKALELDDSVGEAHASLAILKFRYEKDFSGAEREFNRAIELNPNYPAAHHWYSHYLMAMRRFDESFEESKRNLDLDPLSPASNLHLTVHYLAARQYDLSIEQGLKTLRMDPNYVEAHRQIGHAYLGKGLKDEAIRELEKAKELSPNVLYLALLGNAYALVGRAADARKILADLLQQSRHGYVQPYFIAAVFAGLGETEPALAWLDKAYSERTPGWINYRDVDQLMFQKVRFDPRYRDLLRRIGLPE